jgi:2-deoxy-D-gluconate 3-dehydrogenase
LGKVKVDLKGKVALVTGAGKGLGRAASLALAEAGARVGIVSRTPSDLASLEEEIRVAGGDCFVHPCDVSRVEDIRRMVDRVHDWGGKIDLLVNSAGINIQAHALEVTEEQWDKVLDVNLKGAFFCCQAAARKMVPRKEGKIINLTSAMAMVGFYRRAAYCSSKGGLSQLTKVLAVELAPYNIQVNCVAPTFIRTPLTAPMFEDPVFYDEVVRRIPLGKIGEPDDVTGAILYLASDSADFVTGSSVLVDGGWVAW